VYRVVEKVAPTLLLDEVDSFQESNEELRGILNSGHTKTAAFVIRNVGENHEPRLFSTWCPMVLAAIGSLPDTLEDRSVIVRMQRRKKGDYVERLLQQVTTSLAFKEEVETIRRQCMRWTTDNGPKLQTCEPEPLAELGDRANNNWGGLLAIATLCGGEWLSKAKLAALGLSGTESTGDTIGELLLADIKDIFEDLKVNSLGSAHICEKLEKLEERPWATWSKGKPITQNNLARLLNKYGIKSQTTRLNPDTTARGYEKANFEDAWARYIPPKPLPSPVLDDPKRHSDTVPINKGQTHVFQSETKPTRGTFENSPIANVRGAGVTVSLQNPEFQREERRYQKEEGVSLDF